MMLLTIPVAGMNIFGTRALGMGGAQVALVDDATAAFWNPAAFGNQVSFSTTESIFGFSGEDNLTQYVNDLNQYYKLKDLFPDTYEGFMDYIDKNPEEAHRYVDDIVDSLAAFNDPGVGIIWDMHSGVATRVGPAVVSWLYENHLEAGPWVDNHLSRLIPSEYLQSPTDVLALYEEGLLTDEEMDLLWPGYDPDDPNGGIFIGDRPGNGIGLEDNRSLITLSGLVTNTIGLSYGYSFELTRDDYIAVGGTLKFIHGERSGDSVGILSDADLTNFDSGIFDVGSNWILNNMFTLRTITTGSGFSMDLGVQGSLGKQFSYGLLAHNLIPTQLGWDDPRFEPTPINPELRIGAAYEPVEGLSLALDLDLLPVDNLSCRYNPQTGVEEDAVSYHERSIALGAEYNLAGVFIVRAGVSTNYNAIFEEASPAKFILSAGMGFNIGEVFHMSLAVMSNLIRPREVDASLGASLSLGFTL
ncbi:MAG: hypothetical protein A2Y64_00710 [Candidatus Coatesbacteria bacterium RBG_13_66_14]|uniref:DUF5723 domain-containing protein n=1 Tax=Candidatus Coatesbacteria bacterium RBG_13_66_14 TaxID=1817816 RepID=A0A1F5F4Q7_9BACT|nr:MAG: hypothetical protein A2Y64_00710 [Candidatus Coatesbacteria bacterium RBG_13_66_14]